MPVSATGLGVVLHVSKFQINMTQHTIKITNRLLLFFTPVAAITGVKSKSEKTR